MTTLGESAIESIVGRFERTLAVVAAEGNMATMDWGYVLRDILTNTQESTPYVYAGVIVEGQPVGVDAKTIGKGIEDALNNADTFLWGTARVAWVYDGASDDASYRRTKEGVDPS